MFGMILQTSKGEFMMESRIERDTMGEMQVPADRY